MRCDYLTKAVQSPTDLKIPNLLHFIQNGVWAVNGSVPAFPAQTFPSHTSMITGVQPSKHGIYINNLVDVANNNQDEHYFYMDVKVKTLIDLAFENNLVTAGVDWPVTVGAPYKYLFPGNVDSPSKLECGVIFFILMCFFFVFFLKFLFFLKFFYLFFFLLTGYYR